MSNFEAWLWGALLLVVLPVLSVGCALVVRRVVGNEVLARHNDVAGFIYAVVGVVYAVLLGFSAIIVWEQFRQAEEGVEQEANELADLYRNAQVFPPQVRAQIAARVRAYTQLVVEKEWPAMAVGKSSPETWQAYNELWRTYQEFTPQDDHQHTWYTESIERLNSLGDQRRMRLLSVRSGVPKVIWAVLVGAGVVTIGFSLFFGTRNIRAHALMTACVALTIGAVLFSILALEHPFAGISRVDPDAFHQVVEIVDMLSQSEAAQ